MNEDSTRSATPVIPLPNPGEGGPVYSGSSDSSDATPVIPLPNPGEGGPVYSGPTGTIAIQPLPDYVSQAAARFLNATHGYPAFRVYIDGTRVVGLLDSGSASGYVRIPSGRRIVTIQGSDGYTYIEQSILFPAGSTSTVAIINRAGGLQLTRIADACRIR